MKVLFHAEQLNYRGTTNSILEYARYNQEILGNESIIVYSQETPEGVDVASVPEIVDEVRAQYKTLTYEDNDHLNRLAADYDFFYSQRAGEKVDSHTQRKNAIIDTTKFGVHCVFQWYDPHGDVYAYISEWMSKEIAKNYGVEKPIPCVPYIVRLPEPNYDVRAHFNIPKDKFVIGRHGGFNTLDIHETVQAIVKVVETRDDIVFLFANTRPFIDHPRVIFGPPFFGQQQKANYIGACDAMIHGRFLGESFGLSIAEFLYQNKPVLAWNGGFDKNHIETLGPFGLLYEPDVESIYTKIVNLKDNPKKYYYKGAVDRYSPYNVMQQFKRVFLDA
jgi:glycosyltransferase involved in cell wall biosynthesis